MVCGLEWQGGLGKRFVLPHGSSVLESIIVALTVEYADDDFA